ncbi:uncharacterized protein TNCV_1686621 [Trichonephila clavipes]|nr:uncharacterized protein TNCV_1686621 [Trichonephila clavipes]
MDLISSRYRKPKGRPTKRRKMLAENSKKRWQKSSKTVDEKNSNSMYKLYPCYKTIPFHGVFYKDGTFMQITCHEAMEVFFKFQEAKNSHDINSKLVSAFLSIGRGHAALETFSSVLNMPTMDRKTFAKCMHNLSVKNKEVKKKMLEMSRQAAREAHVKVVASLKNQKIIDVSVSYDGTWQKRGHTSNLGLGIIIDILSGLVLDFEVLSKYCHNCVVAGRDMGVDSAEFHIWQKGHADECDKNFDGTSGAMEMHAALIMWRRSISDCQMRFVSMLSDGDSKTFQFLSDNKIYGSDIKIEKEECLNHIAKEARHIVT